MISQLSKLYVGFQELNEAYKLSLEKNKLLEENARQTNDRLERLERDFQVIKMENAQLKEQNVQLEEKISFASRYNDQIEVLIPQMNSFSQQMLQIRHRVGMMEKNYATVREEVTSTKASTSENYSQIMAELKRLHQQQEQQCTVALSQRSPFDCEVDFITSIEDRVFCLERRVHHLDHSYSELEHQLHTSFANTYNGDFLWRISEVHRRIQDAKNGRTTSIFSFPFCSGRNGYKMCIRAYLNGDGTGEGTHLSIFFALMKGEYDPLLQWPFDCQVSLILIDQTHKNHIVKQFTPDPQSNCFNRPVSEMNFASGCPRFAKLSVLDNPNYVKEDVMYIKTIVDTTKIFHP